MTLEQEYYARVCERDALWNEYCHCATDQTWARYSDACEEVKAAEQKMHLTWWSLRLRSTFLPPQKYQRQKRKLLRHHAGNVAVRKPKEMNIIFEYVVECECGECNRSLMVGFGSLRNIYNSIIHGVLHSVPYPHFGFLTKRAPDWWYSARFMKFFHTLAFSCSQALSEPTTSR